MPVLLSRLLFGLFPPEEIRQFNCFTDELFDQSFFEPRLHAYNPLIPLKQAVLYKQQCPEEIVSQIQAQSIPVDHYCLLILAQIVRDLLNSERLKVEISLLNGEKGRREQRREYQRLLDSITSLMEQRGYVVE